MALLLGQSEGFVAETSNQWALLLLSLRWRGKKKKNPPAPLAHFPPAPRAGGRAGGARAGGGRKEMRKMHFGNL